jgi:hypothetical protein
MATQLQIATLLKKFAKEVDIESISTKDIVDFKKLKNNKHCKELIKELKRLKVTNDILSKKGFIAGSMIIGRFL